jgi:YgiT-type zinc finger domain-containing protein
MKRKTAYCDLCGGSLAKGETSLDIRQKGELVIVKDIPADICQQCGEAYLSAETSEKIDEFLVRCRSCRPERYIPVPEFSAAFVMG